MRQQVTFIPAEVNWQMTNSNLPGVEATMSANNLVSEPFPIAVEVHTAPSRGI
jgi:hypothetical protein